MTGERVVPCSWRNSAQGGPIHWRATHNDTVPGRLAAAPRRFSPPLRRAARGASVAQLPSVQRRGRRAPNTQLGMTPARSPGTRRAVLSVSALDASQGQGDVENGFAPDAQRGKHLGSDKGLAIAEALQRPPLPGSYSRTNDARRNRGTRHDVGKDVICSLAGMGSTISRSVSPWARSARTYISNGRWT